MTCIHRDEYAHTQKEKAGYSLMKAEMFCSVLYPLYVINLTGKKAVLSLSGTPWMGCRADGNSLKQFLQQFLLKLIQKCIWSP